MALLLARRANAKNFIPFGWYFSRGGLSTGHYQEFCDVPGIFGHACRATLSALFGNGLRQTFHLLQR
jgi:hypothetical protein